MNSLIDSIVADARGAGPLFQNHQKLVRRIAWQVRRRAGPDVELDDLVQIGMVALLEAASAFVERGAAFSTYATMRVRGAMVDHIRRHAHVNRGLHRRKRQLDGARADMTRETGRQPTGTELAARLGLRPAVVGLLDSAPVAPRMESLDHVYADDDGRFGDDRPDALASLLHNSLLEDVTEAVAALPEREALVLQLYFVEELSLEQIGEVLGVGAARVCQLKKRALQRVREELATWA